MLDTLSLPLINRALSDDSWAANKLAGFAGSTLQFSLADKILASYRIEPNGLMTVIKSDDCHETSLTIELPRDAASLFVSHGRSGVIRAARIRGNIDLANALNDVMAHIRPDTEGYLADKIGDVAAHRFFGILTRIRSQAADLSTRLKDQLTEHVLEGHSVIVPHSQLSWFSREVDTLRNDAARLEQRLNSIRSSFRTPGP